MIHKKTITKLCFIIISTLSLNVKSQIVGTDAFLKGNLVEIGISGPGGYEGATAAPPSGMHFRSIAPTAGFFGFVADPLSSSWANYNGDFFTPGTPENGWGLHIGGASGDPDFHNNMNGSITDIPGAITTYSAYLNCRNVFWDGNLLSGSTAIAVNINYYLDVTKLYYTTIVTLKNNSTSTIPTLYYYRTVDPDNNVTLSSDYTTNNVIENQPSSGCNLACVSASQAAGLGWGGSYVAFAGLDPEFRVTTGGFSERNGFEIWNGGMSSLAAPYITAVGGSIFLDQAISIAYRIQNFLPGTTRSFKFVTILNSTDKNAAVNTLFYLSYPGTASSAPNACSGVANKDTLKTCGPSRAEVVGSGLDEYTWNWSPSTYLSSTSSYSTIINPLSTTVYTITGVPTSSCIANTLVYNLVAVPITFPLTISPPATYCPGSTINLTASGAGIGGSYSWYGPGGFSSTLQSPIISSANVSNAGTYTAVATTSAGCTNSVTTTISVTNINSNFTIPSPIQCLTGNLFNFNNTGSTSGSHSYSFSPTIGAPIAGSTASYSGSFTLPGTYTVTHTVLLGGCISASTSTVLVNPLPDGVVAFTSGTITCLTNTINLSSSPSGMTYAWTAPGGSSIVSGATSQNATGSGSGTYSVNITNPINGCSRVATISAIVNNTAPAFTASYTGSITCVTNTVNLSSSLAGMNYSWVAPAGSSILSGASSQNAIGQGSGTYSITCTNPINGCFTLHTVNVTASSALPTLSVVATSNTITCAAPTITLTASSSNTNAVIWSTGTTTLSNPLLVITAGNYVASITDLITGCVNTQTVSIIGGTVIPTVLTASNAVIPCGITTISLTASSTLTTDIVYNWTGPIILSGINTQTPVVGQVGIYTVVTTNTITGCYSTATVNVTQGTITAAFSADPITGGAPLTVNFTDMSTGALTYSWTFDNGNTSTINNPNTNYPTTGNYNVILIITNGVCIDTAIVTIVVEDGFSLEIPNVFTPNDDGTNDIFTIKSTGVKEITLQLFNRWGEKLYEFTGPKAGWDGINANGSKASDGTYFYFIKATGYDGKDVEKQGTFNLFR